MDKYSLLPELLVHDGTLTRKDFFHPDALTEEQVLRTHTNDFWYKLKNGLLSSKEIRAMGFPFHEKLFQRALHIANGSLECAKYAINEGVSLNIAGGTHHSYADRGEGFCLLNDFAIASNELLHHGVVKQILIIDLDVHQGNGTAKIFENESRVFTFSMHGEHNYPLRKEKSDLDIGVQDGINDAEYLTILNDTLKPLIGKVLPDLIFYLSGVDVLATDKLGRLGLTKSGCKERDQLVFDACKANNIPIAVSMGGGYSESISDILDAHANTFRLAKNLYF